MPKCSREERFQIGRGKPLPFDRYKGVVYYHVHNSGPYYSLRQLQDHVEKAFDLWNVHFAPLALVLTPDPAIAYIHIYFGGVKPKYQWLVNLFPRLKKYFLIQPIPLEYDPENENITYAYGFEAFHTQYAGHIYINDLVPWSKMNIAGRDGLLPIVKVIAHESGHVFNLRHTDNYHIPELMLPEYNIDNVITEDSIAGIDFLYQEFKIKYKRHVA